MDAALLNNDHDWPTKATVLHWYHPGEDAWLAAATEDHWSGWSAASALPVTHSSPWTPWQALVDISQAPFVRWFRDGLLNAAFNELDRHVLAGCSEETAFVIEAAAEAPHQITLRQLLVQSTLAAHALRDGLGLTSRQVVGIHLPNGLLAAVWIEAAKRLALPFVAVADGTASSSLAERLADTGVAVLVASVALLSAAAEAVATLQPLTFVVLDGPADGGGAAARASAAAGSVLVNGSALMATARARLPKPEAELTEAELPRAMWSLVPPRPVESSWPLFVLYTSGSTGKPKGIVHTHGGYQVGLCATARAVFALRPDLDMLCVIATPGWITGQSYMLAAALLCRVPSVLVEGSPSQPPDRIAGVLARTGTTVLKSGSTFLRMLMLTPGAEALLRKHDLSRLRLAAFCAEPVNAQVHRFAATHLTPNYINCYWATEHGGIVWGRCHNSELPLLPDARAWPLPWIEGEVMQNTMQTEGTAHEGRSDNGGDGFAGSSEVGGGWRRAADGEQGEVVVRAQYPYMALTVWRSEGLGDASWRGDLARWAQYIAPGAGYVQGDAAVRHADGAFSFHGRSDEVINVGGNRIGTEEIENALRRVGGGP